MAKNKNNKIDGDFDLDFELDDFDFDIPDPSVKDDRKPAIKIAKGAAQGFKDTVRDPKFIKQGLKNVFPEGYGKALDEADRIGQTLKSLYDESARDIKPAIKQAKQAATRLIPADSKLVPERLKKVLDEWRKESTSEDTRVSDAREALLSSTLNDVFQAQAETQAKTAADTEAQRNLDAGIGLIRHRSILETLNRVAMATQSLDQYQTKIGLNWQKKSLELQYRQLMATQDTLAYMREDSFKRDNILLAIAKNSALPEYAKIRDSEARQQAIKNKFYDSIAQGLYGGRNSYIEKTLAGLKKRVGDGVKNGVTSFRNGLSEATSLGEMAMGSGMVDPYELGGNIAGSSATHGLGGLLGKMLGKKLKDSPWDKKLGLSDKATRLEALIESAPNRLNEFRKDNKYAWGMSVKDRLLSGLQGLLPSMAPDTKADIKRGGDMNSPYHFTRRTDRSINEVIPGLLARIYRELQITRTGNGKIGLTQYDHDKGRFTTESKVKDSVLKAVAPAHAVADTQARLQTLVNSIDPDKKLSPEARAALMKQLLLNSADNNMANRDRLGTVKAYSKHGTKVANELGAHMSSYFDGMDSNKEKALQYAHNRLTSSIADPRGFMQTQIDNGNSQHLRQLGLLDQKSGQINLGRVLEMYLDPRNAHRSRDEGKNPFGDLTGPVHGGPGPGEFVGPKPNMAWYAKQSWDDLSDAAKAHLRKHPKLHAAVKAAHSKVNDVVNDPRIQEQLTSAQAKAKAAYAAAHAKVQSAINDPRAHEALHKAQEQLHEAFAQGKTKAQTALAAAHSKISDTLTSANASAAMQAVKAHASTALTVVKTKGAALAMDLYHATEQRPRLRAALMLAGEYRDKATNAVIRTYEDLKGDVIDSKGNLVVEAKELPMLLYYNAQAHAMTSLSTVSAQVQDVAAKAGIRSVADLQNKGKAMAAQAQQRAVALISTGVKNISEAMDQVDIYVENEVAPRITAAQMKAGKIYDSVTEKPILKQQDITGEADLKNELGETVITKEETPKLKFWNVRIAKWSPLWMAGKIAKGLWHYQTQIAPGMAWRNLKRLGSVYKFVGTKLFGATKWLLGVRTDNVACDVYVRGSTFPALYGRLMKEGQYFNVNGGKPVMIPRDINGAVRDSKGQILVTNEEYLDGLFNVDGRKISSSMAAKLVKAVMALPFKVAGSIVKGGGQLVGGAAKLATKGVSEAAKFGLRAIGGGAGLLGKGIGYAAGVRYEGDEASRKELAKIRKENSGLSRDEVARKIPGLTLDKLEAKDEGKFDQIAKRTGMTREEAERVHELKDMDELAKDAKLDREEKEKHKVRQNSTEDKLAHRQGAGKALTAVEAAKAASTSKKEDGGGGGGFGLSDIKDAWDTAKDTWKGGKSAFNKLKGLKNIKGAGKMNQLWKLLRGGRGLATAAEGVEGAAGLAEGGAALATGAGAIGAEGAAIAGGAAVAGEAAAVGGAAAVGAGGILAGVGGTLLAALTSPVLIGAVAVGLVGYGAYKAFKYFRRGHLSSLGKLRCVQYGYQATDTDHAKQIADFESLINDHVSLGQGGIPVIDEKKIGMKDRLKCFDLDYMKPEHQKIFYQWYQGRFKPVYLTHMAAIQGIAGKLSFDAAEDLKPEQRKRYIDAVAFSNGPYGIKVLPMDPQTIAATNGKDVAAAVAAATMELSLGKEAAKVATTVLGAVVGAGSANAAETAKQASFKPLDDIETAAATAMMSATSQVGVNAMSNGAQINALDAVRYKTYGLVSLVPERVQSLRILEKLMEPNVTFGAAGNATWNGDISKTLEQCGPAFGLSGLASPRANDWYNWFSRRFLPVYLVWMSAYKARTGKTTPSVGVALIRPQDQYEIAKLMVGTKGAWAVTASPWDNVKLGVDDAICKDNLVYLQDAANKTTLAEQKKSATPPAPPKAPAVASASQAAQTVAKSVAPGQAAATAPAPDAEAKVAGGAAAPALGGGAGSVGTGNLVLAAGDMMDGRNAQSFLKLASGVDIEGLNPQMRNQLMGLIEEYGTLTGKSTTIRDGFRTYEDQQAMRKKYGARAAAPGTSLHEYGLAVDIDQRTLDEMEKLGLMRKYGFTRPVGQEPWHMEPIGTQDNLSKYKQDQQAAAQAIMAGAGKGGGGWALVKSAAAYTRNNDLSSSIASASVAEKDPSSLVDAAKTAASSPLSMGGQPGGRQAIGFAAKTADNSQIGGVIPVQGGAKPDGATAAARASNVASGAGGFTRAGRMLAASNDAEYKVSGTNAGQAVKLDPSDPTVKIPDPKGTGIDGLRDTILAAAKMVGIDGNTMLKFAAVESDFNPNAAAGTSSAQGLFQFTAGTWGDMIGKYGKQYGYTLSNTSPNDAKAASLMAAHYLKDNLQALSKNTSRPLDATAAYMTHFLGEGGASKFLAALDANPNAPAAQLFPGPARQNQGLFYDGGKALSVTEVYSKITGRMNAKAKLYGIGDDTSGATAVASTKPTMPNFIPPATASAPVVAAAGSKSDDKNFTAQVAPVRSIRAPIMRSEGSLGMPGGGQARPQSQPQPTGFSADMLKSTEGLLSKQVDLTAQILKVVSAIAENAGNKVPEPAATPAPQEPTYTPPPVAVSMKRARYA